MGLAQSFHIADSYIGLFVGIITLFFGRQRLIQRRIEARTVANLVQEALDNLQDQEYQYHIDPVNTPEPFIVPAHLRDLILQEEHSPQVRQRLWKQVENIVEGNANVRANREEVRGEDTRVWRWVGGAGLLTPRRSRDSRRVSFADRTESGSLIK